MRVQSRQTIKSSNSWDYSTKSRLERVGRPKVVRAFDVPRELFDYDEVNDEIIVTDETGFDKFVDSKCIAQDDRDQKKVELKNRMLDQVKQIERRKRSLSVGSLTSLDSPSRIRSRSNDSAEKVGGDPKQSRLANSQPAHS